LPALLPAIPQPMVTSSYSTLENTAHSYQIVQGDLGIKLLLQKNLLKQQSVCFDTETTDLMHFMLNL
jgi:hypothetical protein